MGDRTALIYCCFGLLSKMDKSLGKTGIPLTGREYLQSLDDGREAWIYGKRVSNVAEHPAFRNTARMVARLYDALHDPLRKACLTYPTEGGYTHRFYLPAKTVEEQIAQRDAIADWQRSVYGWMGRSPDYCGAIIGALGANGPFYQRFKENARNWYEKACERTWYFTFGIQNPPIDKGGPESSGVHLRVVKENDAGVCVSGVKVVCTSAVLSHYVYISHEAAEPINFIVPASTPGLKLLCRVSNEYRAGVLGSPFDYPLSSRFDENDSILVFDNVFIPWENVLAYKLNYPLDPAYTDRFIERNELHGITRFAVKMDFLVGLLARGLSITGASREHGVRALIGEVVAWRNIFWAQSDAIARSATPWHGGVAPDPNVAFAGSVLQQTAIPRIRSIIEQAIGSGFIYLNSHTSDFKAPEIRGYLDKYLRGTDDRDLAEERVKVMKALWDALGTEFGGRHELFEISYHGNSMTTRIRNLQAAFDTGNLQRFADFAKSAMDEYDLDGWTVPDLINPDDISVLGAADKTFP
jgi:4-hydroxyphenylacetate 3-monooxygenase